MYLEIKDVKKSYGSDASYIQVLKGITTSLEKGQMCVIQGTSGSGKSTLLNCIGGLDTMDSGSVKVDGKEIFGLKPDKLADYRKENLGFIFQFYNLVPNLTDVEKGQLRFKDGVSKAKIMVIATIKQVDKNGDVKLEFYLSSKAECEGAQEEIGLKTKAEDDK